MGEPIATAVREAATCGVTRLADITHLDCIGVPVFQAIRPWSRALSVHQGKGLTCDDARIGALMEAMECDHAEAFDGRRIVCAFEALPEAERAPEIADFASARRRSPRPAEPLAWVEARRLDGAGSLWVPFDVVSLDFSRPGDPRLDQSSNGIGARFDSEGAIAKALLEVIERDADRVWQALPLHDRSLDRLDPGSMPFCWFAELRRSLRAAGLRLAIYRQTAIVPLPVFFAELSEPGAAAFARGFAIGVACHSSPEEALLGSVLEAVQSRLTSISGVRDDILFPDPPRSDANRIGFGLPLPPGVRATTWDEAASPFASRPQITSADIVGLLAEAGYPGAAVIDLSRPGRRTTVVKAVVPGLGAFGRRRRGPGDPS
ncbi:MAG TPA: YcaO-like family protein [Caulobacteraceae bacterium]